MCQCCDDKSNNEIICSKCREEAQRVYDEGTHVMCPKCKQKISELNTVHLRSCLGCDVKAFRQIYDLPTLSKMRKIKYDEVNRKIWEKRKENRESLENWKISHKKGVSSDLVRAKNSESKKRFYASITNERREELRQINIDSHNTDEYLVRASDSRNRVVARQTEEERKDIGKKISEEHNLPESKKRASKDGKKAWDKPEAELSVFRKKMSRVQKRPEVVLRKSLGTIRAMINGFNPNARCISGSYRGIPFASALEYRTMKTLDILEREWKRVDFQIPWMNELNQSKNYLSDLLVEKNKIWEVKPVERLREKSTVLKARYARKYVKTRGFSYSFITEKEIEQLEQEASKRLDCSFDEYSKRVHEELNWYKNLKERKKEDKKRRSLVAQLLTLLRSISYTEERLAA